MSIEGLDARTYSLRLEKLEKLRSMGKEPFGHRFNDRRIPIEEARRFADRKSNALVRIAGRISSLRLHGKATFIDLVDVSAKIQILLQQNVLGNDYEIVRMMDVGDIVGADGRVGRTKRGEVTLFVEKLYLLCKALIPPPEKWHGLRDTELRYRRRYVDMFTNTEVRERLLTRTRIIKCIRHLLDEMGFIEVETPVMQPLPGGAEALPFVTHHKTLDTDLYLRIALELYLKRLLVGGLEKVYEIGRIFRNEGISPQHSPEFTMLELYQAYGDYTDMMRIVEALFSQTAMSIFGTTKLSYQGKQYDLEPPYPRLKYVELFEEKVGCTPWDTETIRDKYHQKVGEEDISYEHWHAVDKLFEWNVEDELTGPIFVVDHPVELSPLAKRKADEQHCVERFEFFLAGLEMANAFTELNDPVEQRIRFEEQMERVREDGIPRKIDEDFLTALSYGMPPAGGLGVGIDRMVMFFTDTRSIREVITFPLLRPKE